MIFPEDITDLDHPEEIDYLLKANGRDLYLVHQYYAKKVPYMEKCQCKSGKQGRYRHGKECVKGITQKSKWNLCDLKICSTEYKALVDRAKEHLVATNNKSVGQGQKRAIDAVIRKMAQRCREVYLFNSTFI